MTPDADGVGGARSGPRRRSHDAGTARERIARVVGVATEASPLTAALGIAALLAASWGATRWMGGAGAVAPHWFYFAILLAAARFGIRGAVVTALISGVLVGPLMPLDVSEGTSQRAGDWVSRTAFFVVLGALMALLTDWVSSARDRLGDVARRERHLVRQRAAFIDGISHEFRTPLTVIAGTAQVLKRGNVDPAAFPQLVDGLCDNVDRLRALLEVLIFAGEGSVTSGDPDLLVTDLHDTLARQRDALATLSATSRVRIGWHEPVLVRGDHRLIAIAVGAVLDNALRYSGDRSAVDCDIEVSSDAVALRIRDQGPGLDLDLARACLEAPFSTGGSAEGADHHVGVGLFAASQAMRHVGGTVDVVSETGVGTEVVLTLRRAVAVNRVEEA